MEDIRNDFFGDLGIDPITREYTLVYPFWKRIMRISISVGWLSLVCLFYPLGLCLVLRNGKVNQKVANII